MSRERALVLIEQAAAEGWTELDLSGLGLAELPSEIGRLVGLERLILGKWETEEEEFGTVRQWEWVDDERRPLISGNNLTCLPVELSSLCNLKYLDLSGNSDILVPEWLRQLETLEEFIAMRVNWTEIPDYLTQCHNLLYVNLNFNKITAISENLTQLKKLKGLDFRDNQVTQLPKNLDQLSELKHFNFWNNKITAIPRCLTNSRNLQYLSLGSNKLTEIPKSLAHLQNLQHLDLGGNKITEIPENLAQLQNLQHLELGSNQIRIIPESFSQLQNLQHLHLWDNQIAVVPDIFAQLGNLQHLYLSDNKIEEIPESIDNLKKLEYLILSNNHIQRIPGNTSQLNTLTHLSIDNNKITGIPKNLSQLKNLEFLGFDNSETGEIPEWVMQLKKLKFLHCRENGITEIPGSITQLKSLEYLGIGDNKITIIPEGLTQLENLKILELENNKITKITESIEIFSELEALALQGNPLPISPEILAEPHKPQAIFNYLRQLRSGEVKPLNEAKLLLVGQGSVGKTSLVKRLLDKRFDKHESQTDGLSVRKWSVHVNSKDVRLNVWDFGGQEIYHATHQFFLTKRSLYLLVCNCRTSEDENRIEYWLKLIESFGGKSPVIIVGNKKDEQPLDINQSALRKKYPNIVAILETSCQNGEGIEELREKIVAEVGGLRDVYNLLPLSWFQVKEHLEAMDEDFITYPQYIGICYEHGITEDQSQKQLIDLLHDLGLVLNFQKHRILYDTKVLNPDWVTAGIYALLSDDTLKTEGKGFLSPADLSRILEPDRYPIERHVYLTALMKEFQLGFELAECPKPQFLIPGLLPKDEPDTTDLDGDTLDFQYHYDILPNSVISRFITLSHLKIHERIWWRSGVVLAYTEGEERVNLARVRADREDRKIFIAINGRETTRRLFLGLIRDTFSRIHNSFADLKVTEFVPVPNHPDHPPLDYRELIGLEAMGETHKVIGTLRIRVELRQLLDGYEPLESRQRSRRGEKEREMLERMGGDEIHININRSLGDFQPMSSTFHNHNAGANIANQVNQAQDNAQVSATNFTQHSGTSTDDLLKIINRLRQTAAQFPAEQQEELIIDIDDVEEQIQKPEAKRSLPRIKKRLTALLTAATLATGTVAAANEFTDEVLELGKKVGIELALPGASES